MLIGRSAALWAEFGVAYRPVAQQHCCSSVPSMCLQIWWHVLGPTGGGCKKAGGKQGLVMDVGANFGYYSLFAAAMGCRCASARCPAALSRFRADWPFMLIKASTSAPLLLLRKLCLKAHKQCHSMGIFIFWPECSVLCKKGLMQAARAWPSLMQYMLQAARHGSPVARQYQQQHQQT